ncbi:hypothetical protein Rsub_07790 [Raphidocelis subcapitata]|uniref:F-box domain-containing protein n=1 Tax=Raphidocelis subcapitata TaxID=307507 RepID=A0A2V0P8U0_9CHLO|nr:hypothetical protein Rsub_07790 [Raphidocelis subcapitata]|eukprot:GBF95362.1 hypothetical protein Rsub_07790 [Raphidocelis subcapitata]
MAEEAFCSRDFELLPLPALQEVLRRAFGGRACDLARAAPVCRRWREAAHLAAWEVELTDEASLARAARCRAARRLSVRAADDAAPALLGSLLLGGGGGGAALPSTHNGSGGDGAALDGGGCGGARGPRLPRLARIFVEIGPGLSQRGLRALVEQLGGLEAAYGPGRAPELELAVTTWHSPSRITSGSGSSSSSSTGSGSGSTGACSPATGRSGGPAAAALSLGRADAAALLHALAAARAPPPRVRALRLAFDAPGAAGGRALAPLPALAAGLVSLELDSPTYHMRGADLQAAIAAAAALGLLRRLSICGADLVAPAAGDGAPAAADLSPLAALRRLEYFKLAGGSAHWQREGSFRPVLAPLASPRLERLAAVTLRLFGRRWCFSDDVTLSADGFRAWAAGAPRDWPLQAP